MNARPDWSDVAERQHLRHLSEIARELDEFADMRARVCEELRADFARAFNGDEVLLPRVVGGLKPREVRTYTLGQAIGDATCEGEGPAVTALRDMLKPGADLVHCLGRFREAVIDAYVDEVADDLANVRLGVA